MNTNRIINAVAAGVLSTLILPVSAFSDELPKRKPGLWEVSIVAEGYPPQIVKQCTDEATEQKMMKMGTDLAGQIGVECSKNTTEKNGSQYVAESDCMMGKTRMISKSVFSGDFQSQYSGDVTASYEPPLMGQAGGKTKITAKRLGECEAGQVPGDVVMANGMKMNVNSMGRAGAAVPAH